MEQQTAGGTAGGIAGGIVELAPPVLVETCVGFRADDFSEWPVCAACGWLEEDHAAGEHAGAVVTELSRRRVRMPERKAS
jgi:hypothetical protein